jgi:hypothetical protein
VAVPTTTAAEHAAEEEILALSGLNWAVEDEKPSSETTEKMVAA